MGGQPRSLEDAVAAPGYEVAHTFHVRPGYDLATEAAMRGLFEEEPTLTLATT